MIISQLESAQRWYKGKAEILSVLNRGNVLIKAITGENLYRDTLTFLTGGKKTNT